MEQIQQTQLTQTLTNELKISNSEMSKSELMDWLLQIATKLNLLRNINLEANFLIIICETLLNSNFTHLQKINAEKHLLLSNFEFRGKNPKIEIRDFYPNLKELTEIGFNGVLLTSNELTLLCNEKRREGVAIGQEMESKRNVITPLSEIELLNLQKENMKLRLNKITNENLIKKYENKIAELKFELLKINDLTIE
jgi:hypothetical protein